MKKITGVSINADLVNKKLIQELDSNHADTHPPTKRVMMAKTFEDGDQWIAMDSTYPEQIAMRIKRHQTTDLDWVINRLGTDETNLAEEELLSSVVEYVTTQYPKYFQKKDNIISCALTGVTIDLNKADPLVAASLLASEDFLVMMPDLTPKKERIYSLGAGALLFPNGWSLKSMFNQTAPSVRDHVSRQKWEQERKESQASAMLGKSVSQIHGGVDHFQERLVHPVDQFFRVMEPGTFYWRRNWAPSFMHSLWRHPDSQIEDKTPRELSPENFEEHGYIHSEHETFRKLPQSGAVIFTIKTYSWKLSDIKNRPDFMADLKQAYDNLPPKMHEYREWSLPYFEKWLFPDRIGKEATKNPPKPQQAEKEAQPA